MMRFHLLLLFLLAGMAAPTALAAQLSPADVEALLERSHGARIKGDSAAPVTIVEISDFQCPFCAQFALQTLPALDSAYVATGKVRFIYVNLPLPSHREAWRAAEAAMCAGAQDAFWPMHDRIFREQAAWSRSNEAGALFDDYARDLGLDGEAFRRCTREDRVSVLLIDDLMQATRIGANSTPFFIFNGRRSLAGAQPFEEFRRVIEDILEEGS
jgi:protein-disulfide isomerase